MIEVKINGLDVAVFGSVQQVATHVIPDQGNVRSEVAVAINPEKIIASYEDDTLKKILARATLRFPDGIGVVKTMHWRGAKNATRIPGCELWEALMQRAAEKSKKVFLVGSKPDVLEKTKQKLTRQYSTNVVGTVDGYFQDETKVIKEIKDSGADIVTVALGTPKQELFIFKCKEHYPEAFYMGVGGTYDAFAGELKRAPEVFRKFGFEWFYRLLLEPTRFFRQAKLIKYCALVVSNKI